MPNAPTKDFLTDEEMARLSAGAPDFIPDDQAGSLFGSRGTPPTPERPFDQPEDRSAKIRRLQEEASVSQREADRANSPLGFAKNFGRSLLDKVTGAVDLGETIGETLATPFVAEQTSRADAYAAGTQQELLKRIREKKGRGEDTSRLERAYNELAGAKIDPKKTIEEALPSLSKSTAQVLGEVGLVGLDVLSAGTFGAAARGARTGALLPSAQSTVPTVAKGVEKLAKEPVGLFTNEGARRVGTGGALGYGYDVASGLQAGEENPYAPGWGTLIGAGLPLTTEAIQSAKNIGSPEKFVERRTKAFSDLFDGTVTTKKLATKMRDKGTNVAEVLAANDKYIPDVQDGKIVADKALVNVQDDASALAKIIRGVIETDDRMVNVQQLRDQALQEIRGLKLRGDEYNRVRANILRDFDFYAEQYANAAGEVPLTLLDDIKKAKYENINWNNPDLLTADRAVARAARRTIENNITSAPIRKLNAEVGKLYDAQEMLEKLQGRAIKGGRLGKYFARTFGIGIGGFQGPFGAIVGGVTGDILADAMQTSYFQNPILKRAVGEIIAERPEIFRQAEELLTNRAAERAARPLLPAPRQ